MLIKLPGASINLTCPGHDPEKHSPVHWKFYSDKGAMQLYKTGLESTLHLSSLQPNNSGNYSCFRAHKLAGTVRLLVEGEEAWREGDGFGGWVDGFWNWCCLPARSLYMSGRGTCPVSSSYVGEDASKDRLVGSSERHLSGGSGNSSPGWAQA